MDVDTTGERGFIERLQDGFRGQDDVYLGGFIGVLLFIALMTGATCVAVCIYVRQKKRLAAHQARSGGVKTVSDQHEMVSFVDKERERSASDVSLRSTPYAKIPGGESQHTTRCKTRTASFRVTTPTADTWRFRAPPCPAAAAAIWRFRALRRLEQRTRNRFPMTTTTPQDFPMEARPRSHFRRST
jgi:hypothetical protein